GEGYFKREIFAVFPRQQNSIGAGGSRRAFDYGKARTGRRGSAKQHVRNSGGGEADCGGGAAGNGRSEPRRKTGIWNCDRPGQSTRACRASSDAGQGWRSLKADGRSGAGRGGWL